MKSETFPTVKLDIGAQPDMKRDRDFRCVDMYGEPDIKAPMWKIPLPDESVDEIFSSHALEHTPRERVIETLVEWLRLLKPGGRLELIVPNFDYVAKYWLTGPDRAWAEAIIFGLQRNPGDYHRCAFNPQLLRADLEGVGFVVKRVEIIWSHTQESVKAIARKADVITS